MLKSSDLQEPKQKKKKNFHSVSQTYFAGIFQSSKSGFAQLVDFIEYIQETRSSSMCSCVYIHTHRLWNRASLQASLQSGEQSGQIYEQAGKPTTFFNVTKPRSHLLQFLLANTNREGSTEFTTHFRKYLLILLSLVMLCNRTAWTVISLFQFHVNQFIVSLTPFQMKAVLSPQYLEYFGRCRIFKHNCFFEYWLTTKSFLHSLLQLSIRKELEFNIAGFSKI